MTVRAAVAILAIAWCARIAQAEPPTDAPPGAAPPGAAPPGAAPPAAAASPAVDPPPLEIAADEAFRAAQQLATSGDPAALDAFEAIGDTRPITRWTDDAWAEAARLAERAGDFARARHALMQVIAIGTDLQLVRRARGTLERLTSITGDGRWDAVAKEHERLVTEIFGGDDPRAELAALATLVDANPDYPRANAVRGALARGWEQEGDRTLALRWYRAAADAGRAEPGRRSHLELVRALLRADDLDAAEVEIELLARGGARSATGAAATDMGASTSGAGTSGADTSVASTSGAGTSGAGTSGAGTSVTGTSGTSTSVAGTSGTSTSGAGSGLGGSRGARALGAGEVATVDTAGLRAVRAQLATAQQRAWLRRGLWAALAILVLGALFALRRDVGSLASAGRRLVRPPIEVVFLVPLAALLIIVGYRGNPLVAHAVRDIAIGGLVIAWISGALLEATRARHGRVPVRRAVTHAVLAVVAVAALAYLALDRDHLLDLVSETWRGGVNQR